MKRRPVLYSPNGAYVLEYWMDRDVHTAGVLTKMHCTFALMKYDPNWITNFEKIPHN